MSFTVFTLCSLPVVYNSLVDVEGIQNAGRVFFMTKKERAKNVKIATLFPASTKFFPANGKLKTVCPFHKDKTNPNFFVYVHTNTWFCFAGCGGGDSIAFIMQLNQVGFTEALNYLNAEGR
jgi:DNA primase